MQVTRRDERDESDGDDCGTGVALRGSFGERTTASGGAGMSLVFDAEERALLAWLADELIPAGDGFPSASAANVASSRLGVICS